jgi:hypothetical protein
MAWPRQIFTLDNWRSVSLVALFNFLANRSFLAIIVCRGNRISPPEETAMENLARYIIYTDTLKGTRGHKQS